MAVSGGAIVGLAGSVNTRVLPADTCLLLSIHTPPSSRPAPCPGVAGGQHTAPPGGGWVGGPIDLGAHNRPSGRIHGPPLTPRRQEPPATQQPYRRGKCHNSTLWLLYIMKTLLFMIVYLSVRNVQSTTSSFTYLERCHVSNTIILLLQI